MFKMQKHPCALVALFLVLAGLAPASAQQPVPGATPQWEPCGWGGGGFYYAAVFHPARNGVLYLGGDVAGVYKSEDHARNWRLINNGLADYGVFSLAVDRTNPQTVYAATEGGLCKSVDGGEHWKLLPRTERKELRITGEKGRSIRSVAVAPSDGNVVYAASPGGKVYKSGDGGQTWKAVYAKQTEGETAGLLRVQFGKVNDAYFGGIWLPLTFPAGVQPADGVGLGFSFKGDKSLPQDCFLTLKTASGISYRSKNLKALFQDDQLRDVVFKAGDFSVDPDYAKKNPDKTPPATPDWATVNRMDFACSGPLPTSASVARIGKIFFAVTRSPEGQTGTAEKPILVTVKDFATNKTVQSYGNIRVGDPPLGGIYSVAVADKDPSLVLAATADAGLVLSEDAGQTWRETNAPKKASSAAVDPANPNVIYGSFFTDGIWKSLDKGKTWTKLAASLPKDFSVKEVAVSPANSLDVYAIGAVGWGGGFYLSNDGGQTWKSSSILTADSAGNPTLPAEPVRAPLSNPTNIAINPLNPKELYISANWRSCLSEDGGLTWAERNRGADISCITDIRFSNGRTYVTAMDEGTLVSENNGKNWRQLWPSKWIVDFAGHNWRVAVNTINGVDRIISTVSPWDQSHVNRVAISEDGGKTYKVTTSGLPNYLVRDNTMWGTGYPRALAVDPKNPNVVYLGMDGDASPGKSGGGIFKSEDGGATWKQLPNQPASRRVYYGLAVDPTDSKRLYWGACGTNGGLHRSEDGGATWKSVFSREQWIFNVLVAKDGTVYCPGQNLWRSTDHGATWQQLTKFSNGRPIVGLEADPRDPKTLWISTTTWDGSANGAVYKTTDGGATWQDITGNLPYVKPQILRFNPATNELWCGFVSLNKLKQ
jgi:photosystem II stability/assembly factor-like uncharacterized protein